MMELWTCLHAGPLAAVVATLNAVTSTVVVVVVAAVAKHDE